MHESEHNRLQKRQHALLLAADDMAQAGAALSALEREKSDHDLMRALETAIAVSYARAFTTSSVLQLDQHEYLPEDPIQAKLHDQLLLLRDKVYAHTDRAGGRSADFVEVMGLESLDPNDDLPMHAGGVIRNEWIALPRESIPSYRFLIEGQAQRFIREALTIERRLREPQTVAE